MLEFEKNEERVWERERARGRNGGFLEQARRKIPITARLREYKVVIGFRNYENPYNIRHRPRVPPILNRIIKIYFSSSLKFVAFLVN